MSFLQKASLKKRIKRSMRMIEEIEHKRERSQAALVSAILTNTTPDDRDVDYFNTYTNQINELRDSMQKTQDELDGL